MFSGVDRSLTKLPHTVIIALAVGGLGLVGIADYQTGYEISFGIFYLLPVGLASWYCGRKGGVGLAFGSSLVWHVADVASGFPYHNPAIPIWNAFVRLGFFLITALLLCALRERLSTQRQLARIDALTSLSNLRAFVERFAHDLALANRTKNSLTLVYLDLDNFKKINDRYGHSEGNRVLCDVAQMLLEATRRTDTVARLGGDEFALILPATTLAGAEVAVTKFRHVLSQSHVGHVLGITCSIGLVEFRDHLIGANEAIAAADRLMYDAKVSGKNAIISCIYTRQVSNTIG